MAKRPILIVSDDKACCNWLVNGISSHDDFIVASATTLEEADAALQSRFDLLILDIDIANSDDYCTMLRQSGNQFPIIMVSRDHDESAVVRGIESGANDFLTKPVRVAEMLARMRAHLRSFETSDRAVFYLGPYTFRPSRRMLEIPTKNRRIRLTDKETSILKYLYHTGIVVNRDALLHEVWGYNPEASTHTLETHIYRLRQKIETNPFNPVLLLTENGGYRLNPEPSRNVYNT